MSNSGPVKSSDQSPDVAPNPVVASATSRFQAGVSDFAHLARQKDLISSDKKKIEKNEALLTAARENQHEKIPKLVSHGADINYADPDGLTALHIAVRRNSLPFVQALLSYNAEKYAKNETPTKLHVNPITKDGFTPLHIAAEQGHLRVANLLLQNQANVDAIATPPGAQNDIPLTPIVCAFKRKHPPLVELLQRYGAKLPEALKAQAASQDNDFEVFDDDAAVAALIEAEQLIEKLDALKKKLNKNQRTPVAMVYHGQEGGEVNEIFLEFTSNSKPALTFAKQLTVKMQLPNSIRIHEFTVNTDPSQGAAAKPK